MRIRCLISFYSPLVFERLAQRLFSFPLRLHDLRMTPRILKAQWQPVRDRLRRDSYRRLLQPAYRRPRTIAFA